MQGMASYIYKNVQDKKLADVAETEEQTKKKITKHQMDPGTQAYIPWTIIYNIQTKSKFRKKTCKVRHSTQDWFLDQGNRYRKRESQEGRRYRRAENSDLQDTTLLSCAAMIQNKQ